MAVEKDKVLWSVIQLDKEICMIEADYLEYDCASLLVDFKLKNKSFAFDGKSIDILYISGKIKI
jgi:hypothetical protein